MDGTAAVAGGAAQAPAPAVPLPIMHDGDRYEHVRDIGSGNFGVARLMRCRATGALVAVKYIERGQKVPCHCQLPPGPALQSRRRRLFVRTPSCEFIHVRRVLYVFFFPAD
jgi:hypothetical protein